MLHVTAIACTVWLLGWLTLECPCPSCPGEPRRGRIAPGVSHQCWTERGHLPPAGSTFSWHSLEGWWPLLQGHVAGSCSRGLHQDSRAFPTKLLCRWSAPSILVHGDNFYGWTTLSFPLLKSMKLLSDHLSSLLRSMWMAAQPPDISPTSPNFVASTNLLRVCSA